jgi:hypothetical protein
MARPSAGHPLRKPAADRPPPWQRPQPAHHGARDGRVRHNDVDGPRIMAGNAEPVVVCDGAESTGALMQRAGREGRRLGMKRTCVVAQAYFVLENPCLLKILCWDILAMAHSQRKRTAIGQSASPPFPSSV